MANLTRKAFLQTMIGMPCLLVSGCASWFFETKQEEPSRLPQVPIPEDVIVAEVSLIRAREPQLELVEAAWGLADEQITPIERRRDLLANGFRCGRFGGDLPQPIRDLLQIHEEQMALAKVEGEVQEGDPTVRGLRMQLRAARKGEIRVRGNQPQISVLLATQGTVRGGSFPEASCAFQIRGYPSAASCAEIELTPYIEFGLPMRNWEAGESELKMNIARPTEHFTSMRMNCQLGPGEILLVGPNTPAKGLGGVFFHERLDDPAHALLLIRLALSQVDSVFRAPVVSDA
jgi:hypothetical protein